MPRGNASGLVVRMAETEREKTQPTVLLVVNDEALRAELRATLGPVGFELLEPDGGASGVEEAAARAPDLVLLEVASGASDGLEIVTRLRGRGLVAPIVALVREGSERGLSLTAGCDGSIELPLDPARLPSRVRQYLAGKRERLKTTEERRYLREYAQGLVEKLEGKVQELTTANERLTKIDRFRTEFMQSVSHELSTPLTPITGYLKILRSQKLGELNERQGKVIDSMLQSSERLSRVLDNLVDFANLETGRTHLRREAVEPRALVDAAVAEVRSAAKNRRVGLEVLDGSRGRSVVADGAKLRQAIGNLVDNAVKFSPSGGQVLVELLAADEGLTIAVYDQGAGVPPGEVERIFEPLFHSASRAAETERAPGAGLGLPVARMIVETIGGTLTLESPPRRQPDVAQHHFSGARFSIVLPWDAPSE